MSRTAAVACDPPRQCRDGLRRRSRSLLQNIPPHHQSAVDAKETEGEWQPSGGLFQARRSDIGATYQLAHPTLCKLISRCRALTRIVNARDFFKNIVNRNCLHTKIVAADRLPVVVGVHARTACDAGPESDRVCRSRGK